MSSQGRRACISTTGQIPITDTLYSYRQIERQTHRQSIFASQNISGTKRIKREDTLTDNRPGQTRRVRPGQDQARPGRYKTASRSVHDRTIVLTSNHTESDQPHLQPITLHTHNRPGQDKTLSFSLYCASFALPLFSSSHLLCFDLRLPPACGTLLCIFSLLHT